MDPKLKSFLDDYRDLLPLCNATDVAGIAVDTGKRIELLCCRITAGSAEGSSSVDLHQRIGSWHVFRYRRDADHLRDLAESLPSSGSVALDTLSCEWTENSQSLHRNDFVRTPDVVLASAPAPVTWLRIGTATKIFADYGQQQGFERLVAASSDFYNVQDLVRKLVLRQSLNGDDAKGIRFEVEPGLWFRRAEWREADVVLHFAAPAGAELADARVKWQATSGQNVAPIVCTPDGAVATVSAAGDSIDATVIFRTLSLAALHESRPEKVDAEVPTKLAEYFPDLDIGDEPFSSFPDYSKFGTTRRGLRISIKKQVAGDERFYKIVARDIEDALWCLEQGKYKLAAILSGGIIEAILLARLAQDTPSDRQTAFSTVYPGKTAPSLEDMKLFQLIAVANKRGRLKEHKIYDGIRDWRNFVHPKLEADEGAVDVMAAQIAVNAAVRLLLGKS